MIGNILTSVFAILFFLLLFLLEKEKAKTTKYEEIIKVQEKKIKEEEERKKLKEERDNKLAKDIVWQREKISVERQEIRNKINNDEYRGWTINLIISEAARKILRSRKEIDFSEGISEVSELYKLAYSRYGKYGIDVMEDKIRTRIKEIMAEENINDNDFYSRIYDYLEEETYRVYYAIDHYFYRADDIKIFDCLQHLIIDDE